MTRSTTDVAERSGWQRASFALLVAAAVVLLGLTVTGIHLSFEYRPGSGTSRSVHRALSVLLLPVTLGLVVTVIGRAVERGRRWPVDAALVGGVLIVVLATSFTGYLLPWDHLALGAVTVGEDFGGVWRAGFDDGVEFVLIDASEISTGEYARWTVVHLVALPVVLVGLGGLLARRLRRS